MNIDEALIERIIREVVSQVVAEKAAGGGQNRSASGNNQNSFSTFGLWAIFHARACSRPPEPNSNIFMSFEDLYLYK